MILRLLGMLFIAVAIVFAVGDIARSIADETTRLITVAQALASFGVDLTAKRPDNPFLASLVDLVGPWSMSLTAAAVGFALLVLGRKRRHQRRPLRR